MGSNVDKPRRATIADLVEVANERQRQGGRVSTCSSMPTGQGVSD